MVVSSKTAQRVPGTFGECAAFFCDEAVCRPTRVETASLVADAPACGPGETLVSECLVADWTIDCPSSSLASTFSCVNGTAGLVDVSGLDSCDGGYVDGRPDLGLPIAIVVVAGMLSAYAYSRWRRSPLPLSYVRVSVTRTDQASAGSERRTPATEITVTPPPV